MKTKKRTTRAARFAAAEKGIETILNPQRDGLEEALDLFGYVPDDDFTPTLRWQPEDLHEMGLLR